MDVQPTTMGAFGAHRCTRADEIGSEPSGSLLSDKGTPLSVEQGGMITGLFSTSLVFVGSLASVAKRV